VALLTENYEAALGAGFYVEITGVTGAGKTTWAASAIDRLRARGHAFETNHPTRFHVAGLHGYERLSETRQNLAMETLALPFVLGTPALWPFVAMGASGIVHLEIPIRTKVACVRSVFRKVGSYIRWRSRGPHVVHDEGPIHSSHNTLVSPYAMPTELGIRRFAERVPLPDLIVYIHVEPEIAVARTLSRPDPPRAIDAKKLRQFVMNAYYMFESLLQHPRIVPRVIRVKNAEEGESMISRIDKEMSRRRRDSE
jgi:thymidylate kinase